METFRQLDHALFHKIHDVWRGPLLAAFLPLVGRKWLWLALLVAFFAYAHHRVGWRTARLALLSLVLLGASDLTANVLKGEVGRLRPGRTLAADPELAAGRRASFSFPSSAATNAFAAISLWSVWHPELAVPLFAAGGVIAYSRVYAGEHYPADVVAGAVLGCFLGLTVALFDGERDRRRSEEASPGGDAADGPNG